MSRSRARNLGVALFGLTVALAAGLLWRDAAGVESVANALRPDLSPGEESAADRVAADSARPARPRRQVVPDVEVLVNIPSGRLQLLQGDSVVRSYPVSVGSARYPTPVGSYLLATVIWNPWWNPPPESEWARDREPTPPGPGNPMGRVKLHMDELIYIHGTTSEGRLGAPASHGCIRMSNADVVDLARRLHRLAAPSVTDAELDRMSAAGRNERHTVMARSIRMRVTYDVAELRGDRLHVFPDVYGRGGFTSEVRGELARGGVDTAAVPAVAMSRLRASAVRGGASFALAEVPYLQPLPAEPPREQGPRLLGTEVDAPRPAPRDTLVIPAQAPVAEADTDAARDTIHIVTETDTEP
jgi:hypothetical protein